MESNVGLGMEVRGWTNLHLIISSEHAISEEYVLLRCTFKAARLSKIFPEDCTGLERMCSINKLS